jgi:hypothetical protein
MKKVQQKQAQQVLSSVVLVRLEQLRLQVLLVD